MSNPLQISKVDLRYLLNLVKAEIKREINCHAIGTIITFDASTATATVAFNYKKILRNRNAVSINEYNDVIVDYPVLIRVPVVVMSGGGGYTTYPIFSGDQCLLMFCDRDIDLWLEQGSTNSAPLSDRTHDISDAVALVGLNPVTKPIAWATDGIVMAIGQVIMKFTALMASLIDSTGQRLCQSGFGQPFFGTALPSGYLWCDGSSYNTADYPTLFAAVGYTYGGGGGTFNVPDMRGRVAIGLDNINGNQANVLTPTYTPNRNILGASTGEESHELLITEMEAHQHLGWGEHPGAFSGWPFGIYGPQGFAGSNATDTDNTLFYSSWAGGTGASGGFGKDPTVPHNNVPPGTMVNWIIKI